MHHYVAWKLFFVNMQQLNNKL